MTSTEYMPGDTSRLLIEWDVGEDGSNISRNTVNPKWIQSVCQPNRSKFFNVLILIIHSCSKIQTREEDPNRRHS